MNEVRCADGCGKAVEKPEAHGWTRMEITGRYRCPVCMRQLDAINRNVEKRDDDENKAAQI